MHQLGHGIVGSIIEEKERLLKEHGLWQKFLDYINPIISDVSSFRLDWCKLKTLPKKNWLGEDCFGFARLFLYVFSQFLLEYDLCDYRDNTTEEQVDAIFQMLNTFHAMIYLLMNTTDDVEKERRDIHVRMFLNCCHRHCKEFYASNVTEFWATKSNFVSLLNLAGKFRGSNLAFTSLLRIFCRPN